MAQSNAIDAIKSVFSDVSGLTWTETRRSALGDDSVIFGFRYRCPCGEISGNEQLIFKSMTIGHAVGLGKCMRRMLYDHIINEGNKPNFERCAPKAQT